MFAVELATDRIAMNDFARTFIEALVQDHTRLFIQFMDIGESGLLPAYSSGYCEIQRPAHSLSEVLPGIVARLLRSFHIDSYFPFLIGYKDRIHILHLEKMTEISLQPAHPFLQTLLLPSASLGSTLNNAKA